MPWRSAPMANASSAPVEDGTLEVWDADTGSELLSLKGHAGLVYAVAFSPDGKRIVSGGQGKTAKVWDAVTGQRTLSLMGHIAAVNAVAFSPDGKRIVSGNQDKTVKVWDADTGSEILSLKGPHRRGQCRGDSAPMANALSPQAGTRR